MKHFVAVLLMLCLFVSSGMAQETIWEEDTVKNYPVPVGICSWEDVTAGVFYSDMKPFYDAYSPSIMNLKDIASVMRSVFPEYQLNVVVYFGAWCGDSQEHLPAFIRCCENIAEIANFEIHYTLIGVNRNKKSGSPLLDAAQIEKVPTFVVSLQKVENGKAVESIPIGNIVEFPESTIEEDIYMMLAKEMKYNPR